MTHQVPKTGYVAVFQIAGIPTYIHWSFPVYGCVVVAFLGKWSVGALVASALAYLLLVLAHEAGHAVFARRAKSHVYAMVVTGGGGRCYAERPAKPLDRLLFYAGGLIAQVILLALSITYLLVFGYPESYAIKCYLIVLTLFNVILFIGNIIPWRGNDGEMLMLTVKEMCSEP